MSEMTAVCTSAALRKYTDPTKAFVPPLSREYIRDRIDIDDPLNGWQIRHRSGGWLQGYILWTNFTTWTHYFHWDSLHPESGLANVTDTIHKDASGALAKELEALPRSGDPKESGIIFDQVAEIALLGGLGCGEYLLRMALEEIQQHETGYKYVVLQATEGSKRFYERFGFVRVGAVCRYGSRDQPHAIPTLESPEQGYRHWTHANESSKSLEMHGGPSYMMCLKLPEKNSSLCDKCSPTPVLDAMLKYKVDSKPIIEQVGASSTPGPKKRRRSNSFGNIVGKVTPKSSPGRGRGRPTINGVPSIMMPYLSSSSTGKRVHTPTSGDDEYTPAKKKRKYTRKATPLQPGAEVKVPKRRGRPPKNAVAAAAAMGKAIAPSSKKKAKAGLATPTNKPVRQEPRGTPPPDAQFVSTLKPVQAIRRDKLYKQKVKSYPRDHEHFFNKVVMLKTTKKKSDQAFYFCVHFSDAKQILLLVPMHARGTLSGKRAGRPRFQCAIGVDTSNMIQVSADKVVSVEAVMIMKTPLIAQEAWDILMAKPLPVELQVKKRNRIKSASPAADNNN